jgi:bacillithiol biosynthesis deacetylase BshB1
MKISKVDVLAIGAHPDDIELGAGGTLAALVAAGKKVGMLDLTLGELGSRGNAELRTKEAMESAEYLGVAFRIQLNLGDGQINTSVENKSEVIRVLRASCPDVVFANTLNDRHIDHGNAALLVKESCFLSGLAKWETMADGQLQLPWRPQFLLHYIQDHYHKPTLVVDITKFYEQKRRAILTFGSQFYNAEATEPETPISSEDFLHFLESRAREKGRWIGCTYGEGFVSEVPLNIPKLHALMGV